jgi:hypothetical protein
VRRTTAAHQKDPSAHYFFRFADAVSAAALLGWAVSSYNMDISLHFIEIIDSPADLETERD